MKMPCIKQIVCGCLIVAMGIVSGGCRPSVRDVADLLYKVPLGSSRDAVRKVLMEAYGNKYPNWKQSYGLIDPPKPVTDATLKADKDLASLSRRDHRYCRVYPSELLDNMPAGALTEMIGIVAEASDGNGSVSVFYDSHTNYIGFMSDASGPDR
jgi:hypothetical protein